MCVEVRHRLEDSRAESMVLGVLINQTRAQELNEGKTEDEQARTGTGNDKLATPLTLGGVIRCQLLVKAVHNRRQPNRTASDWMPLPQALG